MTHLDQGVPEWDPSSTGPGQVNAAIRALVERGGMVFPTDTARDTALPPGDRRAGMRAYVEATGQESMVAADGGDWSVVTDLAKLPLSMVAAGTPMVGTVTVGSQFMLQAGTKVVGTDSNGYSALLFPVPFPNGLLAFFAWPGESPGGAIHHFLGPDISLLPLGAADRGNFRVVNESGASVAGTSVRCNWLAIGF